MIDTYPVIKYNCVDSATFGPICSHSGSPCCRIMRNHSGLVMVNWNTQHLPSSEPATAADAASERFRASVGTRPARRLPEPPAAMAEAGFTAELWDRFTTDRFRHWHSIGGILEPLCWLEMQGVTP